MRERYFRLASLGGAVVVLAICVWWILRLRVALRQTICFDDAFMFWRYAINIRHGLGISWNLDGVHTYGQTAPLWGAVVLALSFVPAAPGAVLMCGSWVCSGLAAVALAVAVSRNASSEFFRNIWRVLPLVVVPLALGRVYLENAATGMETMLAVLLLAVYVGLALRWQRGLLASHWLGLAGFLLFLVRPESLVIALLVPACSCLLLRVRRRELSIILAVLAACVAADLALCQMYFHTAVPLSFYMKSGRGYQGFADILYPMEAAWSFLSSIKFYLACMALFVNRRNWRLLASFVLPALAVFAYLATTMQVMGYYSRYSMPYLALFVVPALLLLDDWVNDRERTTFAWTWNRQLLVRCAVVLVLVSALESRRVAHRVAMADVRMAAHRLIYDPVQLQVTAQKPLVAPVFVWPISEMGDVLLAPLPPGATIAATEVGYLGVAAPQVNVIDLAGLNDTRIALDGFDRDKLLARKPDIIWLPHPDYTYERGMILSDPALLEQYDIYAGAEIYGIAIRKQTPYREAIMRQMEVLWSRRYPRFAMSDYLVEKVTWSGHAHELGGVR